MKKIKFSLLAFVVICVTTGCAAFQEEAKLLWGSSTKTLEGVRGESVGRSFSCSWEQCFDAVINYANIQVEQLLVEDINVSTMNQPVKSTDQKTITVKNLEVFLQDRNRKVIVVMGVPGSVNTTEVGVFFTATKNAGTLVEIASLSTAAKVRVADILYTELGTHFKEIN